MAAGGTTTLVNLLKVKSNDLLVGNGVTGTGSLRVTIASDNSPISVNSAQPTTTGALTAIGTGGQLTAAATILFVGQTVVIAGTNTGTGTITNGTYRISVTNGSTTFTLVNLDGTAITTTAGTPVGVTYSTYTPDVISNLSMMAGQTIAMGTGVRSAGTQRVTIATDDIVPVSQSGTWNIGTLTSITNALPTGSNSIGNIGTVATVTSLTQFNGTAISMKAASTAAVAGDTSLVVALSPNTALPSGTNAIGKLAANTGVTIGAVEIAATQTLSTVTTVGTLTSLTQFNGNAIATNTGVRSAGTLRVTIATDDIVPVSQSGTWNINALTSITNALPAGTNAIGKLSANSGVIIGAVEIAATQTLATLTTLNQFSGTAISMKAASTAAVAGDTSLVVALSPNTALPAGTNAIGKLAANDGVDIGDVTVNNLISNAVYSRITDGTNTMPTGDAAARGIFFKITDGGQTANVKGASTAPTLADPALVVALSPNSQQLSIPATPTGATASTGGLLPASTTYFFKIVAVDAGGGTTPASAELSFATAAGTATNTITLTWTPTTGADNYQVWWSTTTGTQGSYFLAPINLSTSGTLTNSYVFTTVTSSFSGTIPATNTTSYVRQKAIQPVSGNLNATVTGTVELGATSLAALENISVTVPGTVDLGTISLTALESITVVSGTPNNFQSKIYGAVTTAAPAYTNATDNALSLTTAGALRVDGSAVTQPVSGPLTSAQTLTALTSLTQFNGVAISMKAASTAAVAADTALVVAISPNNTVGLSAGTNAIGKLSANSGVIIGDVNIAASQTIAVTQATAANLNATVSIAGSQTLGTVTTVSTVTNLSQLGGTAISMNTGVRDAGTQRVTIATNDVVPVSGTFWQATQPVSIAASVAVTGPLTSAQTLTALTSLTQFNGTAISMKAASTAAVAADTALVVAISPNNTVGLSAGTNAIGKLSANSGVIIGDVNIAASQTLSAVTTLNQFNGTAISMKAASTAAAATDTSLVVALSPNTALPAGTNVLGTMFVNGVMPAGTATASAGNAVQVGAIATTTAPSYTTATLNPLSLTTAGALRVDGSAVTQPVSLASLPALAAGTNVIGTVTLNASNTNFSSQGSLNQTNFWNVLQQRSTAFSVFAVNAPVGITIVAEVTVDGVNWIPAYLKDVATGTISTSMTNAQLIAGAARTVILPAGAYQVRTRMSTWTSGTINIISSSGHIAGDVDLTTSPNGSTIQPPNLQQIGGWDGTNLRALSTDVVGRVNIGAINSALPTGTNSIGNIGTVATVTNLAQLGGAVISMGTGVRNPGTLRVTIATDDVVQTKATPDATGTYSGTNATTGAYATNLVVKATAGTVYMLSGYNSLETPQFIQIHNAASLPSDTSVPVVMFYVPALSNFCFDFGVYGRYFSTGIVVCNSTTGPTKTIGAANCWFDAQYK